MSKKFFVTGTDTDVGKTLIAAGLLLAARQAGFSTAAIKPVAAGCEKTPHGLRNSDALQLQKAMTAELDYEQINPITLEPAIAPHIAAEQMGKHLRCAQLAGYCRGAMMSAAAEFFLIEGAGGWRVPLNQVETLANLAMELNTPVILVVGMRLGCINHALLTAEAIHKDGLPLAGWVANQLLSDMPVYRENLQTLVDLMPAPLIGEVPFLENPLPEKLVPHLTISHLIND